MMSRLELEGMLNRLKMQRFELKTKAAVKINAIKNILVLSSIRQIDEIDIEGVHALAVELLGLKRETEKNLEDKKKIEKELE
ncbi:MAG: hypothetical protein Q8M92_00520 [Candidatus Subteraquimicrobiales bacterium]|nr:hypothetical protein [Candidatus Subteraquimicrobiales bacterium]